MSRLRTLEAAVTVASPPAVVFDTWLSPAAHTAMSGQPAFIDGRIGGQYTLWGGSVKGEIIFLKPHQRIAQTWRTPDFDSHMEDSRLELTFHSAQGGTRVQVVHAHIPAPLYDQFLFGWTQVLLPQLRELSLPS
jgi:uncharacterized protein YndB with AHSA1/START domain